MRSANSSLRVTVRPARELSDAEVRAWADIQRRAPELHSPFYRPEYARAMAAVRPGVEVGVLESRGEPVGFFPFERGPRSVGGPVGGVFCDMEGAIVRPGVAWKPRALVRACGLRAWRFRHVPLAQEAWGPFHLGRNAFAYMDLSAGGEAYARERRSAGTEQLRKAGQKARKAEREIGPARFVAETRDAGILRTLLAWKREHYRRMEVVDVLAPDWARTFLESLLEPTPPGFGGMLSALYFGDRLAAAHLGIRSHEVLHAWFPSYDPELGAYSPGLLLFLELARKAGGLGIERIDLGLCEERFKSSLASATVPVAEGVVDLRPVAGRLSQAARGAAAWVRSSPLAKPARALHRAVSRIFGPKAAWLR